MIKTIFLTVALLFTFPSFSQVVFEAGITHATLVPSGIWWQKEYPHSLPKDVPSYGIKYTKANWTIGYANVGRFKSHSLAVASDQAYDAKISWPLSNWYGDESVKAVYLLKRFPLSKGWIEVGPVVTYSTWKMTIPDWVWCPDKECLIPTEPRYLQVGKPKQIATDLMASVGTKLTDNLSLSLSVYPTRISNDPGITKGYSPTISLGYSF